jgi:hypothetical protein
VSCAARCLLMLRSLCHVLHADYICCRSLSLCIVLHAAYVCCVMCNVCPLQEAFTVQKKLHTLDRLAWSDMFETFLANK